MTSRNQTLPRRERRIAEREVRRATARRRVARRRGLGLPALSALAVLGGIVVIAVAIALGGTSTPTTEARAIVARAPAGLPSEGFTIGRADAPVTIELYEDFQCPACRRWGETVFPSLAANELASGQARVVFHDFAFLGPESFEAARAGYAAAQQGRFWDMWATIYANQGHENDGALVPERLIAMAEALGLDRDRFAADMESAAARTHLDRSIAEAQGAGVSSTPTIVIDGRLMVGASYAEIASAIALAAGE